MEVLVVKENEIRRARTCRIKDISVIISGLEVTQRSSASGRVRHDPQPTVHHSLLPQLSKDPPNTLHKRRVHRLVSIIEIDPSTHFLDDMLPIRRILEHNLSTFGIVLVNTHLEHIISRSDTKVLVDLVFNGKSMRVPTESTFDVMSSRVGVSRDHILDRTQ